MWETVIMSQHLPPVPDPTPLFPYTPGKAQQVVQNSGGPHLKAQIRRGRSPPIGWASEVYGPLNLDKIFGGPQLLSPPGDSRRAPSSTLWAPSLILLMRHTGLVLCGASTAQRDDGSPTGALELCHSWLDQRGHHIATAEEGPQTIHPLPWPCHYFPPTPSRGLSLLNTGLAH